MYMQTTLTTQMVQDLLKGKKDLLYLLLFFLCYLLAFSGFQIFVYFMFIPLFMYVHTSKKIHYPIFIILLIIYSFLAFWYFKPYGIEFMVLVPIVHILFYVPFVSIAKRWMFRRYDFVLIPLYFYVPFFVLSFTPVNNFWSNYSVLLLYMPLSISYIGSFVLTMVLVMLQYQIFLLLS